jgi:adenine-specific DNA-methyltransferase
MAYLKGWAPRSHQRLELRRPALLTGGGAAVRGDAVALAGTLGPFDLAYLDPPYNQHRYAANYHVWETIVAWDAPTHYGVACKREDLRGPDGRSAFNGKATMPKALHAVIDAVQARVVVVSCSNEGWTTAEDIAAWCAPRGHVRVLAFDSKRYVGAQIGVFNPSGEKVGRVSHLRNVEHLVVAGPRDEVEAMAASAVEQRADHRVDVGQRARARRS